MIANTIGHEKTELLFTIVIDNRSTNLTIEQEILVDAVLVQ
jgi:hypothetical protein